MRFTKPHAHDMFSRIASEQQTGKLLSMQEKELPSWKRVASHMAGICWAMLPTSLVIAIFFALFDLVPGVIIALIAAIVSRPLYWLLMLIAYS